ncbi:unnamed protein product [Adineta ricciae]|uniref:Uncharacterized protein n=1 Tax=Adineta ricciae TaxID=249248 RepID=A0A813PKR8_ADIRI|nr:unnamed protein product [Adineta ricciae]
MNSTAQCPSCFYGSICQFTTLYSSISMESFLDMPFLSKEIAFGGIAVMLVFGTICNILSIATFCQASKGRGNRIYRLWMTIVGQCGTIVFALRLFLIISRQSSGILDCFLLEYLISVLPVLYYSLTACVFIEQAVVAHKHLHFDKESSRHTANLVIPVLIIYHLLVNLYIPFQYQLLRDPYIPTRSWCSSDLRNYSLTRFVTIINTTHIILPFILNLTSPIVMIIILTKGKLDSKQNRRFWSSLKDVLNTYKGNITIPYVLAILTIPYLIVTFRLNCITQSWQNAIYLIAYFIYLIPLPTSLFLFILPSPTFTEELCKIYQRTIVYVRLRQY